MYMTLITQFAACWFVEVVLTNYQDVYIVSLNLLNLLSLITCSVHLRLSLYILISQNKKYRYGSKVMCAVGVLEISGNSKNVQIHVQIGCLHL